MALMLSFPNNSAITLACCSLSKRCTASSTLNIAPRASFCIYFAISTALSPKAAKASFWDFVALSPDTKAKIRFLMPVAAISDVTPDPTRLAPSAAISPDATPPTLPNGPMRVTTSEINGADAAVVLPKKLILSANLTTSLWPILKAVRHFAIISPACSAVISKATPILAALSAKPKSSSRAIPDWPPAATICANPSAAIGMRVDKSSISLPICLNCSGLSKSTTLRTSAMLLSNFTAASATCATLYAMPAYCNALAPWLRIPSCKPFNLLCWLIYFCCALVSRSISGLIWATAFL